MEYISWEDFEKVEIRVGTIVAAEIPDGSNKLIKYRVDFGELGEKTIFSGIQKWFTPEELVGKQTTFVVNLVPKKMGDLGESEGMLFAGEVEGKPALVSFSEVLVNGTRMI
jgi:methionyl-tRNA synthetase